MNANLALALEALATLDPIAAERISRAALAEASAALAAARRAEEQIAAIESERAATLRAVEDFAAAAFADWRHSHPIPADLAARIARHALAPKSAAILRRAGLRREQSGGDRRGLWYRPIDLDPAKWPTA